MNTETFAGSRTRHGTNSGWRRHQPREPDHLAFVVMVGGLVLIMLDHTATQPHRLWRSGHDR